MITDVTSFLAHGEVPPASTIEVLRGDVERGRVVDSRTERGLERHTPTPIVDTTKVEYVRYLRRMTRGDDD